MIIYFKTDIRTNMKLYSFYRPDKVGSYCKLNEKNKEEEYLGALMFNEYTGALMLIFKVSV